MQSFITTNQNANSVSSQSNINFDSLISCIDISKSTWYKFSTNNVGGNADLLISQINCTGDSNLVYQSKVQAVVFSYSISDSNSSIQIIEDCKEDDDLIKQIQIKQKSKIKKE